MKNGIREDGTNYSVYSFARKLGQALSSGMIGGLLTAVGYDEVIAAAPAQYPEVLENVFNLACLIPAIGLVAVSLALLFLYPLNKKRVDANAAFLANKRAK